jgi:G3E family GTPase
MSKIRQIVAKKDTDHIVVQVAPDADLDILAKTFTVANKKGAILSEVARLESLAVVVDARNLLSTLKAKAGRHLIKRVELATVIVLKDVNVLTSEVYSQVVRALVSINAKLRIVHGGKDDDLTLSSLRTEQTYNLRSTQKLDSVNNTDLSSAVVQFTYQDRRPFHPKRLHDLIDEPWAGVLKAQGTFWVASRPDCACTLDIAGGSRRTSSDGKWWVAVPPEEHPNTPQFKEYLEDIWDTTFGDRYQKLTIVGVSIDEADLRHRLDQCLLNDEELADSDAWHALPHPFPWPK